MMQKFLTYISPNKYKGRRRKLRLIVWHSTESPERKGAAYGVAVNWFGTTAAKASAHIVADDGGDSRYPSGIVQCVLPEDTAWHCGNANADGYGIEVVGYKSQGRAWRDVYSLAAIQNACVWIKSNPAINWIPVRFLTDAQLRAGQAGHVTHEQVARVMGGSDHTDPGPDFPKDYVLACLGSNAVPADTGIEPDSADVPIEYGMMGNLHVVKFQQFMARVFPTYAGKLPATGNYLDQTWAVVKEFQARAKVTNSDGSQPDGKRVGPQTYAALRRYGWK